MNAYLVSFLVFITFFGKWVTTGLPGFLLEEFLKTNGAATPLVLYQINDELQSLKAEVKNTTQSEEEFMIHGRIINESHSSPAAGQTVVLQIIQYGRVNQEFETISNLNGEYWFKQVDWHKGWVYQTSVNYDGVIYRSTLFEPEASQKEKNIELNISLYEKTSNIESLSGERMRILLDFSNDGWIIISESLIVSNNSMIAVTPAEEDKPVIDVQLPGGFSSLRFTEGNDNERFKRTRLGVGDWEPVLPGDGHQLFLEYLLPFDEIREMNFGIPIATESALIVVKAGTNGIYCSADGMSLVQPQPEKGELTYTLVNLEAGSSIRLTCSTKKPFTSKTTGVIFVILIAISIPTWFIYQGMKRNRNKIEISQNGSDDKNVLLDRIIALDDRYQAGDLNLQAYELARDELVKQVENLED